MKENYLIEFIAFIKEAELMKTQCRTAWLSNGVRESIAEHSWRMSLMAMCLSFYEKNLDVGKMLKMCIIHDLGEAHEGDIPANQNEERTCKLIREEHCLNKLLEKLPALVKEEVIALWNEYNEGQTDEAKFVRGIDKLETIIQHNQGFNPDGFDYLFNLNYGKDCTSQNSIISKFREIVDEGTREKISSARDLEAHNSK